MKTRAVCVVLSLHPLKYIMPHDIWDSEMLFLPLKFLESCPHPILPDPSPAPAEVWCFMLKAVPPLLKVTFIDLLILFIYLVF